MVRLPGGMCAVVHSSSPDLSQRLVDIPLMSARSPVHTSDTALVLEVGEQVAVFDQGPEAEGLEQLVP